jgi:hypothetical protein
MTATLTFTLPEEQEEFYLAAKGADWRCVLEDLDAHLRSRLKYEEGLSEEADKALQATRDKLHELLQERGLSLW